MHLKARHRGEPGFEAALGVRSSSFGDSSRTSVAGEESAHSTPAGSRRTSLSCAGGEGRPASAGDRGCSHSGGQD